MAPGEEVFSYPVLGTKSCAPQPGPTYMQEYRGTSFIRKCPPPQDHHRSLGIVLLQRPKGARILVSEVSLYMQGYAQGRVPGG